LVINDKYQTIGKDKVAALFADKGTHTTDEGAQTNAACVVAGLKSLPGDPLGRFLSAKGRAIAAWEPVKKRTAGNPPANQP
jgi:rhamnogalacturonan acetylesterase